MNTLYLYREGPVPGSRVRWKIEVDDRQNIVSETQVEDVTTSAVRDETGKRVVSAIGPDDRRILNFFSPAAPCWFQECEDLRQQYATEIAALSVGCPDCQKGAVIRKYQALVKKHEQTEKAYPAST
jgi:hypothetical protein